MRISLLSRILLLVLTYAAAFCLLVFFQFIGRGNFTWSSGAMTVRGSYSAPASSGQDNEKELLSGGVKIFFNGLEINLKKDASNGLTFTNIEGITASIDPQDVSFREREASFGLPDGTVLFFSSLDTSRGTELQIRAEFPEDTLEVSIPLTHRRASLIRENEQLGIMYNGERYFFGRADDELENSRLVLVPGKVISYRARTRQQEFNPADFIIPKWEDFHGELTLWRNLSFAQWSQTASALNNEDDIAAYMSEALRRGSFPAALNSIPAGFIDSPRHGYKAAAFIGGMTPAYQLFSAAERDKINLYTHLIRENSTDILLMEDHLLNFFYSRNIFNLANELLNMLRSLEPERLTIEHCPGILEIYSDFRLLNSPAANDSSDAGFMEKFSEQILLLISENINRDNDLVYIMFSDDTAVNAELNLRLGKSLLFWAEDQQEQREVWAAVSRSIILSALASGGSGRGTLYRNAVVAESGQIEFYPRALGLATPAGISGLGGSDIWAWTISPSIRTSNIDGNLNLAVSFPQNLSHYIIIRGIRPFIRIQIHGTDWRSDSQFERYDSSGWIYYQSEQTLVIKVRHRTALENIRLIYRVEMPPPPPLEVSEPATEAM